MGAVAAPEVRNLETVIALADDQVPIGYRTVAQLEVASCTATYDHLFLADLELSSGVWSGDHPKNAAGGIATKDDHRLCGIARCHGLRVSPYANPRASYGTRRVVLLQCAGANLPPASLHGVCPCPQRGVCHIRENVEDCGGWCR